MALALNHSRAKGNARLILVGIANHDGDGGAWPSLATLAKYCGGLDRKQVKRAIDKLIELGEIKEFVNGGGTRNTPEWQRPNRYTFELKCPEWCDHTSQHRDRRGPLVTFSESRAPGGASTPGSQHPGGGSTPTPGVAAPPEPSMNPNQDLEKTALVPNRARAAHTSPATGRACAAPMVDERHCLYGHIVEPELVNA